jgi:reductive dehalogenase
MAIIATIVPSALGILILLGLGAFGVQSLRERERRAAGVAFALASIGILLILLPHRLPGTGRLVLSGIIAAVGAAGILLFLLPIGRIERGNDVPQVRVDERDIMFARARLVPDSVQYEAYYALHPENRAPDERIRSLPGLLSPGAKMAHPLHFAAADACFSVPAALREWVDGPVAATAMSFTPVAITAYVKGLARYFGARTVGVAELKPYHVYSHIGRGSGEYGAPVSLDHRYAIAFAVEMDYAMIGPAPDAPEILETAKEYSEAAQVAVQLAALIRSLGYPARAHIDGNYRVIAPLVARDAGLGEIGRMGLVMTRKLGPRVRLGVVTTDLPLLVDGRDDDTSVVDFCRTCKKCAENCPSQAIPSGDRQVIDGTLRWRIDALRCFRYWNIIGTDCGRCMAVCPYSHPDNAGHNLVRWATRRSGFARRAALWLDDAFYGRKPAPRLAPGWTSVDLSPTARTSVAEE